MDCGSFFLRFKREDKIKEQKFFQIFFCFSKLDEEHELFSNVNENVIIKLTT